jgi:hypothetical protein
MTGPEHFHRAEQLAAKARKLLGQGEGQATAAVWASVAQVHATLALAAATGAVDASSAVGPAETPETAGTPGAPVVAGAAGAQRPEPGPRH